jgi:hypothetical protein
LRNAWPEASRNAKRMPKLDTTVLSTIGIKLRPGLLRNLVSLKRVQELVERNGELQELSRREIIGFLSEIIQTPIGSVRPNSRLAQSFLKQKGKRGETFWKLTMPCKMKALEILNKMTGYNEPEKIEAKTQGSIEHVVDAALLEQLTRGYYELHKDKE